MNANIEQKIVFEDMKMNVKLKLAGLWVSFMFLYSYVDYFHLYMPGTLKDILAGKVFIFEISSFFLLIAMIMVAIPVVMIFLSLTLPAKINRLANLATAAVFIPYMLFNLVGKAWLHMYFAAFIEVVLLCLIISNSWNWPRITNERLD